jgi:hypothetical protein
LSPLREQPTRQMCQLAAAVLTLAAGDLGWIQRADRIVSGIVTERIIHPPRPQ